MTLSKMDYWRLADELSVVDAAILITGNNPDNYGTDELGNRFQVTYYDGFEATFKALKNAILSCRIRARVVHSTQEGVGKNSPTVYFEYPDTPPSQYLDAPEEIDYIREPVWEKTTIKIEEIKRWLETRGLHPDFFFPQGNPDGFRDRNNPRYSPKLACAVAAWEAVKRPAKTKSVKQSIEDWVTYNAVNFGMAGEDQTVPRGAIEDVAKVVNWNTKGGANPTGGGYEEEQANEAMSEIDKFGSSRKEDDEDLDPEIPF